MQQIGTRSSLALISIARLGAIAPNTFLLVIKAISNVKEENASHAIKSPVFELFQGLQPT